MYITQHDEWMGDIKLNLHHIFIPYIILWCVDRFSFWCEISLSDLVEKMKAFLDLVWKIKAADHMIIWYQWQCHLPIVTSCCCVDYVTYTLWHHNGCLLWYHSLIVMKDTPWIMLLWNIILAVVRLLLFYVNK